MILSLFKQKNTTDKTFKPKQKGKGTILKFLQELGKSLQFPIAVLPFAAILNRFGALGIGYTSITVDNTLQITNQFGYWISYIIQIGGKVVFDNLALFFAIGTAFGLAKDHRGEVALVGAVFYLAISSMTSIDGSFPTMIYKNVFIDENGKSQLLYLGQTYILNIGVLGGITAGCLSAYIYNKYKDIQLPQALSFFGGRRFIPMIGLVLAIPVGLLFSIIWPWINYALMKFGTFTISNSATFGAPLTGIYAALNRLLLPFGLHQILNTLFWFQMPITGQVINPITGAIGNGGEVITVGGDINAFSQGVLGSGIFQSGFFPIMMGGIPAIAFAMIMTAQKSKRKEVAGFLGGVALVSFISGITEPIEFSFVFLSPILLGVHAVLSGVFMTITTAMGIRIGFGFSAGLIDYGVSFAQSWGFANHNTGILHTLANPLWIFPLTMLCGTTYFGVFYWLIKILNVQTVGREQEDIVTEIKNVSVKENTKKLSWNEKYEVKAQSIIDIIGKKNFVSIDNCATRLRLIIKDTSIITDAKIKQIKQTGAFGTIVLTREALQIIIGTDVEHVANKMKEIIE